MYINNSNGGCGCGYNCRCRRTNYGFFKLVGDAIMVCLTFGWWLIWIFVREMRRRPGC